MRLLSIDNVKENMLLARNIYAADGRILLSEGVRLNENYIRRLKELNINSLYITDKRIGKVEVDELVRVQTRLEASKIIKDTMNNLRENKGPTSERVYKIINNIIDEIIRNPKIPFNMMDIRAMNDYLFGHSLAVGILSIMTGVSAGYNYQRLKELGVGAFLHDLGKVLIPEKIVNKVGQLTTEEYTEMKKHSQLGYAILKKCHDYSSVSSFVAWQHHERFNGSGYPRGLKEKDIHEFARIAAIADVYDALSSDRVYRYHLYSHEVIAIIRDESQGLFDPEFVKLFLGNVVPYPIGTMVLLNNNEKALVIKVPKGSPASPVVKVLLQSNGASTSPTFDRDLKKDPSIFITRSLKDNEVNLNINP